MKFIEVTSHLHGNIIYVNPLQIVSLRKQKRDRGDNTLITYPGTDDNCDLVKETPEQIINRINNG